MLNTYKVIVETRDGKTIQLEATWTNELVDTGKTIFGVDLNKDITEMVFNEITKSILKSKINLDNIKTIKFEEV